MLTWMVLDSGHRDGGGERCGTWVPTKDAAPCLSPCPPQAPAGQRPLPAPGLPEGAPAPGHARCCPLVPQASEELCGPAEAVHLREPVAPMFIASSSMMQSDRWMEMTLCPAVLYHTPPLSQNFFVTFFLEHGSIHPKYNLLNRVF